MSKTEKVLRQTYDGKNPNAMAPYAKLMGEANASRTSILVRMDAWWDRHPVVRYSLGFLAGAIMVGLVLYHMYISPPLY